MTTTDVHKGKTIEREKEEGEMKGQREKQTHKTKEEVFLASRRALWAVGAPRMRPAAGF